MCTCLKKGADVSEDLGFAVFLRTATFKACGSLHRLASRTPPAPKWGSMTLPHPSVLDPSTRPTCALGSHISHRHLFGGCSSPSVALETWCRCSPQQHGLITSRPAPQSQTRDSQHWPVRCSATSKRVQPHDIKTAGARASRIVRCTNDRPARGRKKT